MAVNSRRVSNNSRVFSFHGKRSTMNKGTIRIPFPSRFHTTSFGSVHRRADTMPFLRESSNSRGRGHLINSVRLSSSTFTIPATTTNLVDDLTRMVWSMVPRTTYNTTVTIRNVGTIVIRPFLIIHLISQFSRMTLCTHILPTMGRSTFHFHTIASYPSHFLVMNFRTFKRLMIRSVTRITLISARTRDIYHRRSVSTIRKGVFLPFPPHTVFRTYVMPPHFCFPTYRRFVGFIRYFPNNTMGSTTFFSIILRVTRGRVFPIHTISSARKRIQPVRSHARGNYFPRTRTPFRVFFRWENHHDNRDNSRKFYKGHVSGDFCFPMTQARVVTPLKGTIYFIGSSRKRKCFKRTINRVNKFRFFQHRMGRLRAPPRRVTRPLSEFIGERNKICVEHKGPLLYGHFRLIFRREGREEGGSHAIKGRRNKGLRTSQLSHTNKRSDRRVPTQRGNFSSVFLREPRYVVARVFFWGIHQFRRFLLSSGAFLLCRLFPPGQRGGGSHDNPFISLFRDVSFFRDADTSAEIDAEPEEIATTGPVSLSSRNANALVPRELGVGINATEEVIARIEGFVVYSEQLRVVRRGRSVVSVEVFI